MKTNLLAMTALTSSLLLIAAVGANAAPSVNFKSPVDTGLIDLARQGGGGGGGGGGGHGGGGGDGGGGHARGGDGGRQALKGGDYDGGGPKGGHVSRGDRDGKGSDRHAGGGDWKGDGKGGGKHHHGKHAKNFRHYGPDIFVYGGGGYGYGDCGWLRRQAVITGSPYWWQRYQECLYYD